MSDETAAVHAFVHGRVQGVGFRFFVQRQAVARGLTGWVRNLDGGQTVEVVAEGLRAEVDALVEDLRRGPRMSLVERVDVRSPEVSGGFEGFEVRY